MVLLEVQMQGKAGFKHRLWAQTARFALLHPQVQYLEVVLVVPHRRLRLGPDRLPRQLEAFLAGFTGSAWKNWASSLASIRCSACSRCRCCPTRLYPGASHSCSECVQGSGVQAQGRQATWGAHAVVLTSVWSCDN